MGLNDLWDLILMRLLLTGLIVVLLLAGFLLLRRLLPARWLSGRLRLAIWLALLLLSLLFLPLPLTVKLPADWPDWIFSRFLPDPAVPILNQQLVELALAQEKIITSTGLIFGPGAAPGGEAGRLQPANLLDEIPVQEGAAQLLLLSLLPVWRWLYPFGLAIAGLLRLLPGLRRRWPLHGATEKQPLPEGAAADSEPDAGLDAESWNRAIARCRDQCHYYRYGVPVLACTNPDQPRRIWQYWRRHQIPVPAASPNDLNEADCRRWLLLMLDRNAHAGVWIVGLLSVIRVLVWFNPLWILAESRLLDDISLARQSRISRRSGQEPTQGRSWIIALPVGLVLALSLILISWQLPRMMLPDISAAVADEPTEDFGLQVKRSSEFSYDLVTEGNRMLLDQDSLTAVKKGENLFALQASDSQGSPLWQSDLAGLMGLSKSPLTENYIQIHATRHLADGRWSVILSGVRDVQTWTVLLILTSDGKLVRRLNLDSESSDSHAEQAYYDQYALLSDGGWLQMTNYADAAVKIGNSEIELQSYRVALSRYDAGGRLLWHKDAADSNLGSLKLGSVNGRFINYNRSARQIIPTQDSGFYLVIADATHLHLHRAYSVTWPAPEIDDQQIFRQSELIVRMSSSGEILWSRQIPANEQQFTTYAAAAGPDGTLYLAGSVTWHTPDALLPELFQLSPSIVRLRMLAQTSIGAYREAYSQASIRVIKPDGQFAWQQTFFGALGSVALDLLLQPDCLTVMAAQQRITDDGSSTASQEMIWQLDLAGNRQGRISVDRNSRVHFTFVKKDNIFIPDLIYADR